LRPDNLSPQTASSFMSYQSVRQGHRPKMKRGRRGKSMQDD
jgi:hypothetical protein